GPPLGFGHRTGPRRRVRRPVVGRRHGDRLEHDLLRRRFRSILVTADQQIPRTVLPIPERGHVGLTTYDAKDPDTSFPPITPVRPPAGAPNVLFVLIDDCGFGASSAFGGPCNTPNMDKLAARGLKFNRFHTTALCSP